MKTQTKPQTIFISRVLAAIVTVSCIVLFAPWRAGVLYLSPLPVSVQAQVDEATSLGIDGIVVYTHQQGKEPEWFVSGWHNREHKIPADPNALFKIASIGKLYNAAAVAKLVASGDLVLDKTLAEYLPELHRRIEFADKITLRMLVQHRSGIPNYTDHADFSWSESIIGGEKNLNLVIDSSADFEPGTDYGYSNTNYLLLGKIMSRVLGYDHREFIKAQILVPLGLSRTFLSISDVNQDELMSGYYVGYEHDFKALDQGFVATAEEVGIFLRALNADPSAEQALFTTKEKQIYSSIYEYEHTGWVLGYYSIARMHNLNGKDNDTVVVQFVNTVGDNTLTVANVVYGRIVKLLSRD